MKGNNKAKWLKIAGWVLIPYIMILFTFKRLRGAKRIAGIGWAVVALIIGIAAQNGTPDANVATTDNTEAVASAEEVVATEATTAVEAVDPVEEEPAAKEPTAAEEPVAEPETEPAVVEDWQAEIERIASSDGSANEKSDATISLARAYNVGTDEQNEFEKYIVSEYKSGNYLSGLSDEIYALTNIFKSFVVERQYEESEQVPIQTFAFDFHQNTKDVFRGIRDSVESNEEQMDKALVNIK